MQIKFDPLSSLWQIIVLWSQNIWKQCFQIFSKHLKMGKNIKHGGAFTMQKWANGCFGGKYSFNRGGWGLVPISCSRTELNPLKRLLWLVTLWHCENQLGQKWKWKWTIKWKVKVNHKMEYQRLLEHVQMGEIRKTNWGNLKQSISIEGLASCSEYYLKPICQNKQTCILVSLLNIKYFEYLENICQNKQMQILVPF